MYGADYHFGSEGNYDSESGKDEHLGAGHCIVLHGRFPWKKYACNSDPGALALVLALALRTVG